MAEEDFDEFDEEDDDDGKGGPGADQEARRTQEQALEKFDEPARAVRESAQAYDKEGYGTPHYVKAQASPERRADDHPLHRQDHRALCDMVRSQVDDIRKKERELRRIIVDKCGMPARALHQAEFPGRDKMETRPIDLLDLH